MIPQRIKKVTYIPDLDAVRILGDGGGFLTTTYLQAAQAKKLARLLEAAITAHERHWEAIRTKDKLDREK